VWRCQCCLKDDAVNLLLATTMRPVADVVNMSGRCPALQASLSSGMFRAGGRCRLKATVNADWGIVPRSDLRRG
jgi:hypothetical protein